MTASHAPKQTKQKLARQDSNPGGHSRESLARSVTGSFADLSAALNPVESQIKNAKPSRGSSQSDKDEVEAQLFKLRVINNQARKTLAAAEVENNRQTAQKKTLSRQNSQYSSESPRKSKSKLQATMEAVTHVTAAVNIASFTLDNLRQDAVQHRQEREEAEQQMRDQTEDVWHSMFSEVNAAVDSEGEEGGDCSDRSKQSSWLHAKRKASMVVKHNTKPLVDNSPYAPSGPATEDRKLVRSLTRSTTGSLAGGSSVTFAPSKFYQNVHSVIGLKSHLHTFRNTHGLQHPKYHDECEDAQDAPEDKNAFGMTSFEQNQKPDNLIRIEKIINPWDLGGDVTPGSPGSVTHTPQPDESTPVDMYKRAKRQGGPSSGRRFPTARRVIIAYKAKRLKEKRMAESGSSDEHLPPVGSPRSANAIARKWGGIAEEKVDEEGSGNLQSGGAVGSVQKVNFLKERAARIIARESEERHAAIAAYEMEDGRPYRVIPSHRRLGIGELLSPSRLPSAVWEDEEDSSIFEQPDLLSQSAKVEDEFPGELVCTAIVNLSCASIARMFVDVGAPSGLMHPRDGLELLECLFGGVYTERQFPLQWLIGEWVLKDLQSKMLSCVRSQRGVLSPELGFMMDHPSGESFRKHLTQVQENLSRHYTFAPADKVIHLAWARKPTRSQDVGKADANSSCATIPTDAASIPRAKVPGKPAARIRPQKLPYFPYSNDRLKVIKLNEVPPTTGNWVSAQAAFMNTHIRSAR